MTRRTPIVLTAIACIALVSGCRRGDEFTVSPIEKDGDHMAGKYPDGALPPGGLTSVGDQRSLNAATPGRGLELRADWVTTGSVSRGEHPSPGQQFGAQGSEHNGGGHMMGRPPPGAPHPPPARGE